MHEYIYFLRMATIHHSLLIKRREMTIRYSVGHKFYSTVETMMVMLSLQDRASLYLFISNNDQTRLIFMWEQHRPQQHHQYKNKSIIIIFVL